MNEVIKGSGLSLGYEGEAIIENLSFTVCEGDYICIVGDNGTGKSTLVKTLLGLIAPIEGKIEFLNGFKQREIGYLPQRSALQRDFPSSVMEVVLSGCLNKHKKLFGYSKDEKRRATELLDSLNIGELRNSSFQDLSGGQQQRVLLSRALMATDRLLLLDEPTAGLDVKASHDLYLLLRTLKRDGVAILMVTHDIHPALNDADKILHLSKSGYRFEDRESYFTSNEGKTFLAEAGHAVNHI